MEMLERVMQMQNQGMSDDDIYQTLRNENVSPKEITDTINQAKVKNAVDDSEQTEQAAPQNMESYPPQNSPEQQEQQYSQQYPEYDPNAQVPTQQEAPQQYTEQENYPQYQDYYPQTPQAYSQQQNYYVPPEQASTEMISEIAEQVVSEKISEMRKDLEVINSFKNRIADQISDIDYRLKRIESSIDKINQAVAEKILSVDENNSLIHKDLDNLHSTMSKLMNPLVDKYNEFEDKKPAHHTVHHKK